MRLRVELDVISEKYVHVTQLGTNLKNVTKCYIQLRPRTGEVQTRHEYWHLYVTIYAVIIARCGKLCM